MDWGREGEGRRERREKREGKEGGKGGRPVGVGSIESTCLDPIEAGCCASDPGRGQRILGQPATLTLSPSFFFSPHSLLLPFSTLSLSSPPQCSIAITALPLPTLSHHTTPSHHVAMASALDALRTETLSCATNEEQVEGERTSQSLSFILSNTSNLVNQVYHHRGSSHRDPTVCVAENECLVSIATQSKPPSA